LSAKDLPSPSEVQLVLCEDVRVEVNNKLSLNGWFVGNKINVANIGPGFFVPLTFLVLIEGEAAGQYDLKMSVSNAMGNTVFSQTTPIEKRSGMPAVHVVKTLTFPVLNAGTYTCEIDIKGRKYRLNFYLAEDPSLRSQLPTLQAP
jgi:hypothetical protein